LPLRILIRWLEKELDPPPVTWTLCLVFFFSGASALVFETLWFHQAGLAFGNSVWTSSLVLSGFMGGLAVGNLLAARFGDRIGEPVRAYAFFEIAIAFTGVALVYGLPGLGPALASVLGPLLEAQWLLNPARFVLAFLLLLVPSTAMGATLPLLIKALTGRDPNFGRVLGRLYGWNTLGAVAGVMAAEAWLVEILGVRGAALAAGATNLLAALVALSVARGRSNEPAAASTEAGAGVRFAAGRRWLAAAFLSGFALLALEIVWFRLLSLFVMEWAICLALMLGIVLTGIAAGGFAASTWLRRVPSAHGYAGVIAFLAGVCCVVTYAASPRFLIANAVTPEVDPIAILAMGLPLMLPVSLLSGVIFTLLGAAVRERVPSETGASGALTFANTTGAALGALVGGFVLLPGIGMEGALFTISLLYAAVGTLALARAPRPRRSAAAAALALAVGAALFPFGSLEARHLTASIERWKDTSDRVVLIREGLTGTVVYLERRGYGGTLGYHMLTNGYSMSGTSNRNRRYMKLYAYWPIAVHPEPRNALLISYGVGSTARALTDTKALETIDVVDISRAVIESSVVVFPDPATHPLRDPRVRVHIDDGRYFLQTTNQRFDIITGEPPPPRLAGVVNLYTREYFQLMYDRLAEGGIVTYWLPLLALTEVSSKAILRAFCDVFADCSLWHGAGYDLMMVGTRNAAGPASLDLFTRQWRDPVAGPEMRDLGFERPEQIGALFIGDSVYLDEVTREVLPVVDDHPRRIMAASEFPDDIPPDYVAWMDVDGARERFERSALIERLWPEVMRRASLPYFAFQGAINRGLLMEFSDLDGGIDALHAVLEGTDLRSPVLWLLNSDEDAQRLLAEVQARDLARPGGQLQLGVRWLAERRFDEAAAAMARADGHPDRLRRRQAFRLRIYSLCMAGRLEEAQSLARERYVSKGAPSELPRFWSWLRENFGIDPRRSEAGWIARARIGPSERYR
jgi:predicted membrane-bound spermidine synthase